MALCVWLKVRKNLDGTINQRDKTATDPIIPFDGDAIKILSSRRIRTKNINFLMVATILRISVKESLKVFWQQSLSVNISFVNKQLNT